MKEIIRPKKLSQPKAPFSYGIVTKPGKILFLAGQTPVNEHGEILEWVTLKRKRSKSLKI